MACAALGVRFLAVLPEGVSNERLMIIRRYGGEVALVPAEGGHAGRHRRDRAPGGRRPRRVPAPPVHEPRQRGRPRAAHRPRARRPRSGAAGARSTGSSPPSAPRARSWAWGGWCGGPTPRRRWPGCWWPARRSTPSRAGPRAWASPGWSTACRACSTRTSWAGTRRSPCPGPRRWTPPASWPAAGSRSARPAGSTWRAPAGWRSSWAPGTTSPPWPATGWSATSRPTCSTTCAAALTRRPAGRHRPGTAPPRR